MADHSPTHRASMLVDYLQRRFDHAEPGGEPDHHRLYRVLQEGVLRDELQPGTHLPSPWQLATELGIARNTVIHACEQLGVEGYVSAGVDSSTFVVDTAPDRLDVAPTPAAAVTAVAVVAAAPIAEAAASSALILSTRGRALVRDAGASSHQWGAFVSDVPEVRMFPARIWSRLRNRLLRKSSPALLTHPVGTGYLPLRTALADYLRATCGARHEPEQITITVGIHPSLQSIAQLLCGAGDSAQIEGPGYWSVRSMLTAAGVRTVPLPVDDGDMHFDLPTRGRQHNKPPKLTMVSPSHQYPLGSVMSLVRHRALLAVVQATDTWIVEDDCDSEFRYGSRPLPSLRRLDEGGCVLYTGAFSKVLFPNLRIGYLVMSPMLADTFAAGLSEMFRGGQIPTQTVLTDFITEDHFVSHVRRMRGVYAEWRGTLLASIAHEFDDALPVHDDVSGLHLVLDLPAGINDIVAADLALANNVITRLLSQYYQDDARRLPGLLLGYNHMETKQIATRFRMLAETVRTIG